MLERVLAIGLPLLRLEVGRLLRYPHQRIDEDHEVTAHILGHVMRCLALEIARDVAFKSTNVLYN